MRCLARFKKYHKKKPTPFYPRSPYGASKGASYYVGENYTENRMMKIYNGILFNHESERRGTVFKS